MDCLIPPATYLFFRAFAELYDSFVGDSFRVVNNLDVVARMPRATMGGISLDYKHSGRTVMVRRTCLVVETRARLP